MSETIHVHLPDHPDKQPWHSDPKLAAKLVAEFDDETVPKTGEDIVRIIQNRNTERAVNPGSTSPESLFMDRMNDTLARYSREKGISPPITLEQLAAAASSESGNLPAPLQHSEAFRDLYAYIAERYAFPEVDAVSVVSDQTTDGRVLGRLKRSAHRGLQVAARGFWQKVYTGVLAPEFEASRLERLKLQLRSIALDDPESREDRIGYLIERGKSQSAERFPVFRCMYESLYGPIKGNILSAREIETMYNKMAQLEKEERPGLKKTAERIAIELRDEIRHYSLQKGEHSMDRTTKKGQKDAKQALAKVFKGFERIANEPARFLAQTEAFTAESVAARLRGFAPVQIDLFSLEMRDKIRGLKLGEGADGGLEKLLASLKGAIKSGDVAPWATQCAEFLNATASISTFLHQTANLFSGDEVVAIVERFAPLSWDIFASALKARASEVDLDTDELTKFNAIADSFAASRAPEALRTWAESCSHELNDILTRPPKVEIQEQAITEEGEAALAAALTLEEETPEEVQQELPVKVEGAETEEKIVEGVLASLKNGDKHGVSHVVAERAVRKIVALSEKGKRAVYQKLAPYVESPDWIKSLSKLRGVTIREKEKDAVERFFKSKGIPQSGGDARYGWFVYILIASRKADFRNS